MMAPVKEGRDPLQLARQQLDFAAVAASAPSSKEILFKAQTMVPLSAPRPWRQVATAGAMLALLVGLVLVPWLPQRSALALLSVGFEQRFDQRSAQEVVFHLVRELPDRVFAGAQYESGRLSLRLSSFSRSVGELERAIDRIVDAYPEPVGPYQFQAGQIEVVRTGSPYAHLRALVAGGSRPPQARGLDGPLAEEVLANTEVLAEGMRRKFRRIGRELAALEFAAPGTGGGQLERYSFTVACWPLPLGLVIKHYEDLNTREREDLAERAEEFLEAANLVDSVLVLAAEPQSWLPVLVEVRDGSKPLGGDGRSPLDPRLTQLVQAWVEQPSDAELSSIDFEPRQRVDTALEQVLPGYEYRLDQKCVGASSTGVPLYRITVTVTGVVLRSHGQLKLQEAGAEEDLDY